MLSLFDRYGESPETGIRFDDFVAKDNEILANFLKKPTEKLVPFSKPKKELIVTSHDRRLLRTLLRNDFRSFIRKVFHTLTPGQTFIPSWHLDAIAGQTQSLTPIERS